MLEAEIAKPVAYFRISTKASMKATLCKSKHETHTLHTHTEI